MKRLLGRITGGGPVLPLVVLFGLNAVDELDRTAFGILLPEIRDEFDLSTQGILTLVAVALLVALFLQVPIAAMADRHRRVSMAAAGGAGHRSAGRQIDLDRLADAVETYCDIDALFDNLLPAKSS